LKEHGGLHRRGDLQAPIYWEHGTGADVLGVKPRMLIIRMLLELLVQAMLVHVVLLVALEVHIQEVVVLDVLDPCVCVYIDFC
jgi:hypothetical protein